MKEKLWNANYIKVMTTNFLLYFAFYLLTPLLPLYLSETFGATKDVIGIVLSGYTVAALIIRPFSGYVVDGFSRFLRHSQIFEQLFVLINTKEVFWNIQALKYR